MDSKMSRKSSERYDRNLIFSANRRLLVTTKSREMAHGTVKSLQVANPNRALKRISHAYKEYLSDVKPKKSALKEFDLKQYIPEIETKSKYLK